MQIRGLHKNIYKLAGYALSQEKLEEHRKKYEPSVFLWKSLALEGVSDRLCAGLTGISRATFHRYCAKMKIGERVQIDHMSVSKNGVPVKHFQAWDRKSKYMFTGIYGRIRGRM